MRRHLIGEAWLRRLARAGHGAASRLVAPIERPLSRRGRERYVKVAVVAVTGSVGKSTTTYLIGQLLSRYGKTALGVYYNTDRRALRLFRKLTGDVDYAVQEVSGGHRRGALASFTRLIRTNVGVVTAVGLDHLSTFRTESAIAAEKSTLVSGLVPGGIAVLNADDPYVRGMASSAHGRVVLYGRSADAEVLGKNISALWPSRLSFDLVVGDRRWQVTTRFVGTVMTSNVLAALAVVYALGHDLDAAVAALAKIEPLGNRMGVIAERDQHTYLFDNYKAALWSTQRLIDDMATWGPVPRVVVLGDMSDIGNDSSRKYRGMLRRAAKTATLVIGVGTAGRQAAKLKSEHPNILAAASIEEVRALLRDLPPSLVLLKSNKSYDLSGALPVALADVQV